MIRGILAYKRISRWTLVLSLATMFALCLSVLPPFHIVSAATSCQGFVYNFDGTDPTSLNTYETGSNISTMTPALCLNNETWSLSAIWDMVAGSGANQYAQIGYLRLYGQSTVYYFAEYDKNASTPFVRQTYGAASGTHNYDVLYIFSTGVMQMSLDSSVKLSTNFDPAVWWSAPWTPQWEGETHDPGDDIAGTSSSPVYFSSMCYKPNRSSGCVTPSGLTVSSTLSRYHVAWNTQNTKFHVWT